MFDNKITRENFDVKLDKKYIGVIEDVADPLRIGRARVRIQWLYGDIPVEDIPWANPKHNIIFGEGGQCGRFSAPKVGAVVEVTFSDGNQYSPEYQYMMSLADDVRAELAKEYDGTHILLFDGDSKLKVYYTRGKGITMQLKGSRVNIGVDSSITIEHDKSSSIIELVGGTIRVTSDSQINMTSGSRILGTAREVWMEGKVTKVGSEPQYSAVLGEPLFMLLQALASAIDAKLYPTPGVMAGMVSTFEALMLSKTVKVSM